MLHFKDKRVSDRDFLFRCLHLSLVQQYWHYLTSIHWYLNFFLNSGDNGNTIMAMMKICVLRLTKTQINVWIVMNISIYIQYIYISNIEHCALVGMTSSGLSVIGLLHKQYHNQGGSPNSSSADRTIRRTV